MVQVTQIYMVAPTSAKHLPVPSLPAASSTNHRAPRLPLLYTYVLSHSHTTSSPPLRIHLLVSYPSGRKGLVSDYTQYTTQHLFHFIIDSKQPIVHSLVPSPTDASSASVQILPAALGTVP